MRTRVPVVVLMLLAAGCSSGSNNASLKSGPSSSPQAVTTAPANNTRSTAPTTVSGSAGAIRMAGFAFDPTPLTVRPGQKIPVTNTDSAEHTVTSDMAGLFLADDVKDGMTVTFSAPTKAGTYTFHCQYHPNMHGTLIVRG